MYSFRWFYVNNITMVIVGFFQNNVLLDIIFSNNYIAFPYSGVITWRSQTTMNESSRTFVGKTRTVHPMQGVGNVTTK